MTSASRRRATVTLCVLALLFNAIVPLQAGARAIFSRTVDIASDICSVRPAGSGEAPQKKTLAVHVHCADCIAGGHLLGPQSAPAALSGVMVAGLASPVVSVPTPALARLAHATPGARAPPL